MSEQNQLSVDAWRGECLNYFARTEAAVARALESAREAGKIDKIRHLAGQRLVDLIELSKSSGATMKQVAALTTALEDWREVEGKRLFLAHGVLSQYFDHQHGWLALFDLTTYRGKQSESHRWAIKDAEAKLFLDELKNAFKALSGQLGHFRMRMKS